MKLTEKALWFATKAHEGQLDKAGKPYIEHPIRVADFVAIMPWAREADREVAICLEHAIKACHDLAAEADR